MDGIGPLGLLTGGGWFVLTAAVGAIGVLTIRGARSSGRADERFLWWLVAMRLLTAGVVVIGASTGAGLCFVGLDRLYELDLVTVSEEAIAFVLGAAMMLWLVAAVALGALSRSAPAIEAEGDADAL